MSSAYPVRVTAARSVTETMELHLPGVTRAVNRSQLAFPHSGHLAERQVTRGQHVAAGEVLAILDNPGLGPQVTAAEARVRELQETLEQLVTETERLENLFERDQVSADARDRVRARRNATRESLAQARAQLDEARAQLAEVELRAPFAGVIVELLMEPGEFIPAGQPVMVIYGEDNLEVAVSLPASRAGNLTLGGSVEVTLLESGQIAAATLQEIGVAMPGRPATVVARINDRAAADWQPGQAVRVHLRWQGDEVLQVPLAAVIDSSGGNSRVFTVVDNRAVIVPVSLGRLTSGWVTVDGDLQAGAPLIVAGHTRLLDGESVRTLP
ncbi:MAG: triclosan efflux RND transporter adaptor protein TriA [Wenzhouxiangellaceae bacterium]